MNILILLGTTRDERKSELVFNYVANLGKSFDGVTIKTADPRDFDFPGDAGSNTEYHTLADWADGYIIVTPEYNRSIPSSLKQMLDSEFIVYADKPVVLMGVSNGPWGGTRAIESLIHITRALNMLVLNSDVQFPRVNELFDESANLLDDEMEARVRKSYEKLLWLIGKLSR